MDHGRTITESQRLWLSGGGDGGPMIKRRNAYVTVHSWAAGGCAICLKADKLLTYLFNLSCSRPISRLSVASTLFCDTTDNIVVQYKSILTAQQLHFSGIRWRTVLTPRGLSHNRSIAFSHRSTVFDRFRIRHRRDYKLSSTITAVGKTISHNNCNYNALRLWLSVDVEYDKIRIVTPVNIVSYYGHKPKPLPVEYCKIRIDAGMLNVGSTVTL